MKILGVLFKIEALKAVKRLAFWVTLGIFVMIVAVAIAEGVQDAFQSPDRPFALPRAWLSIFEAPSQIGPFFLGVMMILLFAPEFSWRTGRQNVIDGLSKERFYSGKIVVLAALVGLFLVIPIVLGAVGAMVSPSESGSSLVRNTDANYMIGYTLVLVLWGSGGFMLAATVRSSGPATGILFVYVLVEQIGSQMLTRLIEALRPAMDFLPFRVFMTLVDRRLHYPEQLASENARRAEQGREPLEFLDFEVLAVTALVYTALFLGTAFLSIRKRDM